jgi:hypothetical protein
MHIISVRPQKHLLLTVRPTWHLTVGMTHLTLPKLSDFQVCRR